MNQSTAIIWDFDGTLVDSRFKNLNVARAIIEKVSNRPAATFSVLASLENYQSAENNATNWREFYAREFRMSETEIDRAGSLWTEYQLRDRTPTPIFPGIPEAIAGLQQFPQGIVSQNGRDAIAAVLKASGLQRYFQAVIGYEEVDFKRQKPAPDGLLCCLEMLTQMHPGVLFYIGDHDTDIKCAARAKAELEARKIPIEVVNIGALYGVTPASSWANRPEYIAAQPQEIVDIVITHVARRSSAL